MSCSFSEYSFPVGVTAYIAHPNRPYSSSETEFPHLWKSLDSFGIQVTQDLDAAVVFISINHSPRHLRAFREGEGSDKLRVLVRLEPRATYPVQYLDRIVNKYDLVITPGSLRHETTRLMWPYFYQINPLRPISPAPTLHDLIGELLTRNDRNLWDCRPYLLTLIASNKTSPTKYSNYALRRRAVKELTNRGLTSFGEKWDSPLPTRLAERTRIAWGALKTSYFPNLVALTDGLFTNFPEVKGQVQDKHSIVRKSKFSLVIENDNHYVSEKIIDALVGGSLPFYMGGNLELVGIHSDVVRTVINFEAVIDTILALTPGEIDQWRQNAFNYVISKEFVKAWSGEEVYQSIAQLIWQQTKRNSKF